MGERQGRREQIDRTVKKWTGAGMNRTEAYKRARELARKSDAGRGVQPNPNAHGNRKG